MQLLHVSKPFRIPVMNHSNDRFGLGPLDELPDIIDSVFCKQKRIVSVIVGHRLCNYNITWVIGLPIGLSGRLSPGETKMRTS